MHLLATSRQDSPPRPRPCAACGAYTHRPRGRACRLGWWIDGSLMALARSRLSMELLHRMFSYVHDLDAGTPPSDQSSDPSAEQSLTHQLTGQLTGQLTSQLTRQLTDQLTSQPTSRLS